MTDKKSIWIAVFIMGCILINCAGKGIASAWNLPVWLDSAGTILTAYALGPVCGAIVGASVNIIYAFSNPISGVYALTSILVGALVGLFARKKMFHDVFGTLTAGFFVSVASVCVSAPLNIFFYAGDTGNLWGDGVIDFLREQDCNAVFCYIAGEFYVDFLDKVLLLCLLYLGLHFSRKIRTARKGSAVGMLFLCLLAGSLFASASADAAVHDAKETADYGNYVQTIYNSSSGLPSGTATDMEQTTDGVLWIGTYNGLYRYNGTQFQWMNEFDSVKNVNCLYTDEEGRLWIGTNDNGLSICIDESVTNVMAQEDGMPSNSVRCIAGGNDGNYYVGTTGSMAVVSINSGISVEKVLTEISYADSVSVNSEGMAAAVTDEGILYLIDGTKIVERKKCSAGGSGYTCCVFDDAGTLYVGTAKNQMEVYKVKDNRLVKKKSVTCKGLSNINEISILDDDTIFVCADNGVGYFDYAGSYQSVNTNKFNSSIDHMLVDYQGNLWFTSSRLGLLKLCESVFTEIYEQIGMEEQVINAIVAWKGNLYFGTDNGLDMTDSSLNVQKENWLTKRLSGIRVRHLMEDSKGQLWIATSGSGVWCVTKKGAVTVYDSSAGALGDKFRMTLELSDHTILLAGDSGITYVEDGVVTSTIGEADALTNPKVLCMVQRQDESVLAGTDGNGIAVITDGRVEQYIKRTDGLSSDIILRICADSEGDGYFVVTGNGLCYIDREGSVTQLDEFPYYNNFDIVQNDGNLFVLGSAGIYVVEREALLAGEEVESVLLDSKKGLRNSLTANAWIYLDKDNNLYLPGSDGATRLNLDAYDESVRSYRARLQSVLVDGKSYPVSQGKEITIESGAKKIEIVPEIVNYSANDPYVSVYLEGVDDEARVMRQSELSNVVYTNLSAGSYTLYLSVLDQKSTVLSENRYPVEKEFELYEHGWFLGYFIAVFILAVAYIVWLLFRTQVQRTLKLQKRELEIAQKQIQMGNETILTIARTVDAKDVRTSRHSFRVSEYSVMIASQIGYDEQALEDLRKTALLHDIGKIGIPDRILNKPSQLTDEEYEIMKSHVVKGAEILKNFTSIDHIVEGALYHHERYDGSGYVQGLKGEEIPLNARIVGIADAFDAMTVNRVYSQKKDLQFAVDELKKGKGSQFDPALADVMIDLIESGKLRLEQYYPEPENE